MNEDDQPKSTFTELEALATRLRNDEPVICEECGAPAVTHWHDGRWLCERHFQIAFRQYVGRWPGEE